MTCLPQTIKAAKQHLVDGNGWCIAVNDFKNAVLADLQLVRHKHAEQLRLSESSWTNQAEQIQAQQLRLSDSG